MTVSGDFIPEEDQGFEEESQFPTVFGLQLSPIVIGVIAAVLLIGGAIFAFLNLVSPKLAEQASLNQQIAEREQQIRNPQERERLLAEAQARLESAEQLQADVLALFANEESLETLLLDLNARVQSVNAGIEQEDRRAVLSRFTVNEGASGIIDDGSFGEAVNGRLERRVYDVTLEGSFAQIQSILRNLERLQPLLIVQNFNTQIAEANETLLVDTQGNLAPAENAPARLTTSFRLDALLPADQPPPPPPGEEGAEEQPAEEGAEGA